MSDIASGAAAGSIVPGIGTIAGAALGLVPAAFKFFSGRKQIKQGRAINAINPGFQMNTGVIDNARILQDRYTNYQMPGYGQAMNNLQTNFANAYSQGVQGASSGGDVLDLATRLAYGQNQATNNLAMQTAQGRDNALNQYLNANVAAGQEYVNKNIYDRQEYEKRLAEKAALMQSGNENIYGALDQVAQLGSRALTPRSTTQDPSASSPIDRARLQALLAGYDQRGLTDANGDLYNVNTLGINQLNQLKGKLPF